MTCNHNEICDGKNPRHYDNIGDIQKNVYAFSEFKNELIKYLNNHPLISFPNFKIIATKHFLNNKYDFYLKKNTFANIFYKWRNNSKIFSWLSIFDNCYTKDNMLYLRDVSIKLLYTTDGKNV